MTVALPPIRGQDKVAWLYDVIMAQIEPELTSAAAPTLAALYADETDEEAADRAERYAEAFALFDEIAPRVLASLDEDVQMTAMEQAAA